MTDATQSRYVVLADLVGSRGIADREAFDARLEAAMAAVNRSAGDAMSTPLSRMKGIDEFGCVLDRLSVLPAVICGLLDRIHPTLARFGVASGEIDVGQGRDTVAAMDGPAFHQARELLDTVDAEGLSVGLDTGSPVDPLVSGALNALVLARDGITERQMEVILAYERAGTQTAAGEELGVPQQAVSDALRRANYRGRTAIRADITDAIEATYD